MMQNIAEQFITDLMLIGQKEMPWRVKFKAKECLLDYLGVLVGGKRYLEEKHPKLIASVPSKAFRNGFAAHVLELDDGHRHGMIHIGASVITAVLTVAEKEKIPTKSVVFDI